MVIFSTNSFTWHCILINFLLRLSISKISTRALFKLLTHTCMSFWSLFHLSTTSTDWVRIVVQHALLHAKRHWWCRCINSLIVWMSMSHSNKFTKCNDHGKSWGILENSHPTSTTTLLVCFVGSFDAAWVTHELTLPSFMLASGIIGIISNREIHTMNLVWNLLSSMSTWFRRFLCSNDSNTILSIKSNGTQHTKSMAIE